MKAVATTLEKVLSEAESLPLEDQIMLEELLHKRRIEKWRKETAAAGRKAVKAYQSGKLKGQSADNVIAALRGLK